MATYQEKSPETGTPTSDKTSQDFVEGASAALSSPQHSATDAEKQPETPEAEVPPRDIHGWKWVIAMSSILSSIFLYALDNTVVADIQPVIIQEFGHVEKLPWLSVAFLLAATATNLIWGRIFGHFNSKWFYVASVVIFEAGSALCGAAPNIDALIVGRALCGLGGAGLYVGCMTLIAATTTMPERPLYISGTGFTWGLGIVLGPIIGGAFSISKVGWRWAFYINLFIGGVCAPAYIFLIPNKDPRPGVPFKDRIREMDYIGSALQMGAATCFVLAISWGGITYPWESGRIIGLFVAAGVLTIILGIQQFWTIGTTVARRIIPVEFFTHRTVMLLFGVTAASGASAFVPIYFVPIFFQFTRLDGPLEAGIRLLPMICLTVFVVFVNGALMAKFGYYMPWYTVGGSLALIGAALMYTVDQHTGTGKIYGYTALIGIGVGMWLQASFSVAQAVVEPEFIAAAVGFLTFSQFLGITVTIAIANALFLNGSQEKILQAIPDIPLEELQLAMQGAGSDFVRKLNPEDTEKVLDAISSSIATTYILVITGGAFVVILSLMMKREKLFMAGGVSAA